MFLLTPLTLSACECISGDRYEGEWKGGRRHGVGTETWINGVKYEGEWRDGKRQGFGKVLYANGDKYEGASPLSLQLLAVSVADGDCLLLMWSGRDAGEFMGGEKEGKGKMVYSKGGEYNGEWKKGKREGHGVMVYGDGSVYEGQWKDDIEVVQKAPSEGKRVPIPPDFPLNPRSVPESEDEDEDLDEVTAAEQRRVQVRKRLARMRQRSSVGTSAKSSASQKGTKSKGSVHSHPPFCFATPKSKAHLSLFLQPELTALHEIEWIVKLLDLVLRLCPERRRIHFHGSPTPTQGFVLSTRVHRGLNPGTMEKADSCKR